MGERLGSCHQGCSYSRHLRRLHVACHLVMALQSYLDLSVELLLLICIRLQFLLHLGLLHLSQRLAGSGSRYTCIEIAYQIHFISEESWSSLDASASKFCSISASGACWQRMQIGLDGKQPSAMTSLLQKDSFHMAGQLNQTHRVLWEVMPWCMPQAKCDDREWGASACCFDRGHIDKCGLLWYLHHPPAAVLSALASCLPTASSPVQWRSQEAC